MLLTYINYLKLDKITVFKLRIAINICTLIRSKGYAYLMPYGSNTDKGKW